MSNALKMNAHRKTLVLGIGNTLLRDEGAGVHAVRMLKEAHQSDGVELMDGGTLSFALAGYIEDAHQLIVIDAAQLESAPGSIRVFEGGRMDEFVGGRRKLSVHEVSLVDLLIIARLAGRLPERRALIGIQPRDTDWGESPSPPVAAALPAACDHVLQLMEAWQHERPADHSCPA